MWKTVTKDNIKELLELLQQHHPDAKCELDYTTPYELLIAVILSAQCTDKRVNIITKELFKEYNTPQKVMNMPQELLEKYIYSSGFYRNKSTNIISASKDICNKFGGQVPNNLLDLQSLDGVGKKTANVVFSEAFGGDAIAVDTHVLRVSSRLGIDESKKPLEVEQSLMAIIPKNLWSKSHHLLIFHGRYICKAQSPLCGECLIKKFCKYYNNSRR